MQKRRFFRGIMAGNLLFALCLGLAINCGKKSSPTSPSSYIPDSVYTFLSAAEMDTLKNHGMTINEGSTPPNIDGYYYASYLVAVGSAPSGMHFPISASVEFLNQTDSLQISEAWNTTDSTGRGFISGSGNNFTVYFTENGTSTWSNDTINDTENFSDVGLFTGTLTTAGIKNLTCGIIFTSNGVPSAGVSIVPPVGTVLVMADTLAMKVSTYPYNGAAKMVNSNEMPFLNRSK